MSVSDVIADVLAAFAAARRYSYVDRLGNSLDPSAALEALRDALRDFESSCARGGFLDEDLDENVCVPCPGVKPEDLKRAVDVFTAKARDYNEFLRLTREIAVKALSRIHLYRKPCREKGEEGSEG